MNKYKVCVYAISKNEEKFVDRWVDSMKEADYIVVLDTGSTDNTVKKLKKHKVKVKSKIFDDFRFDIARNESLKLIPKDTDICVCIDLDEVFENGWRKKLESVWDKDVSRVRYKYTWSFNEDGTEGVVFMADKIHRFGQFKWTHPVHEILTSITNNNYKIVDEPKIWLKHYPDKTKSRGSYLRLLELSVKEDPEDDRNMHYLGREYMFYGMYDKCIETLTQHLSMKTATWKDERAASMRYIARCYIQKGNIQLAKNWLYSAIVEAPHLREAYIELATVLYNEENWYGTIYFINEALKITNRLNSYITDPKAWGSYPYDILSIAYYNLGKYDEAYTYTKIATEHSPNDIRIKNNLKYIEEKMKKEKN
ncbi:MAG: glycosyltransferase [Clostridia bacterium]|nr:glycosyltransferase [Clostridia bacterium]